MNCEKCKGSGRKYQRQLTDTGLEIRARGSSRWGTMLDFETVDVGPCEACSGTGKHSAKKD